MILEIIDRVGGRPQVVDASQVLVRMDDGTPVAVAAHYGPDGTVAVGSAPHNAEEFRRLLDVLGVRQTVIVRTVRTTPPPSGAVLLRKP